MTPYAKSQWTNFGIWCAVALALGIIFEAYWHAMLKVADDTGLIGLLVWGSLIGIIGALWIGINAMQANLRDFRREVQA